MSWFKIISDGLLIFYGMFRFLWSSGSRIHVFILFKKSCSNRWSRTHLYINNWCSYIYWIKLVNWYTYLHVLNDYCFLSLKWFFILGLCGRNYDWCSYRFLCIYTHGSSIHLITTFYYDTWRGRTRIFLLWSRFLLSFDMHHFIFIPQGNKRIIDCRKKVIVQQLNLI